VLLGTLFAPSGYGAILQFALDFAKARFFGAFRKTMENSNLLFILHERASSFSVWREKLLKLLLNNNFASFDLNGRKLSPVGMV